MMREERRGEEELDESKMIDWRERLRK